MIALWVILLIFLSLLGFILLALITLLAVPITVSGRFSKEKETSYEVRICVLGFKFRLPIAKWIKQNKGDKEEEKPAEEETKGFIGKMKELIAFYKKYKEVLGEIKAYLKPRVHIDNLSVKVDYGAGDAAVTGILYSLIAGPLGVLHSILDAHLTLHKRQFIITPHYNETLFSFSGDAEIRLRLWTLFAAGVKLMKEIRKNKIKEEQDREEIQWQIRWKKS